ncbi:LAFE_0C08482g1_1 [Lachancea fermentati]|uniref:2,5-diamino-6-ribosylamino-4(3H)-pyrimidinone 5'-phosphate reductase n=1 Tax=Lachancea fermentati TaxID=4955 RepID=A0A1G4M9Y2_LACFM|nr:LAFE_0C08482g1_1 [Lachancea fermentati]
MSILALRSDLIPFLEPFLPQNELSSSKPFVTLTYAQSVDSRISKGRGLRTTISHKETKAMTHYLRFHHDGIVVGAGTALADDPGLNCKWSPSDGEPTLQTSPRPIIIDPHRKWKFKGSQMENLFIQEKGKAPIIIVKQVPPANERESGVTYMSMQVDDKSGQFNWQELVHKLKSDFNLNSIMVEGGAIVINDLLNRPDVVDSLIVTIGATYLGKNGVEVSPLNGDFELKNVTWWRGTRDAIMCANL